MNRIFPRMVWLTILLVLAAGPASALRCGTSLVRLGDGKLEVLKKCGEPFWRDVHVREQAGILPETSSTVVVDVWTYNFGPESFLYFLTFENGRLVEVRTGDYGFVPGRSTTEDLCRHGTLLAVGDAAAEVLKKCGEPDLKEVWVDETDLLVDDLSAFDTIEEWSYNFGSEHFIVIVRLRNGRVVKIEQGERGY